MSKDLGSVILRKDNTPAHKAAFTYLGIDLLGFDVLDHPPYSQDLAPINFVIYPLINSQLKGVKIKFQDSDELKYATIVSKIDSSWYMHSSVFCSWLKRC